MGRIQEVGEQFKKDVHDHALTIIHDDGLHRHLRFKRPGTMNHYFDLVTWPGYLAYTGDMGDFVFTRVEDMLTFFRGHGPNPYYWAEKCTAADKNGGLEEFSEDQFKAAVAEVLKQHLDAYYSGPEEPADEPDLEREAREDAIHALRDAVEDDVFSCLGDDQDGRLAVAAAMDVEDSEGRRPFDTIYEHGFSEWTWRFLWCCHAIPWAVTMYDARLAALASTSDHEITHT